MAERLGVIFVELDIDKDRWTRANRAVLEESKQTSLNVEENFKKLGVRSDVIYKTMANNAIEAFNSIKYHSKATADEIFRSQSAMVAKINSLNQEMKRNPLYETLGIRSVAAINAQKEAIISSYQTIKASGAASAQDLVNLERAKNAKLKELNKEMVGQHDMSMAAMMRSVLRFYAAYYVASTAAQAVVQPFVKGFKAVEDYNTNVASMAAMVMTFAEKQKGVTLEDQWRQSLRYSSAMIPILEQIAARTLLSGEETTALANAFARSGVFLDATNAKQIESFTRISNALPLMTKGQEVMRQINTEIRSLMTGANEQSSMMFITLKSIDPQIKEHLKAWRAEDTVMEHIGELLKGFGPATSILEMQWTAVKTTIDTTVAQTLRAGMQPAYQDIIALTKELGKGLEDQKGQIASGIYIAWSYVKNTVGAIWGVLQGFGPLLSDLGKLTGTIAYGWGGVLAALKPIGEMLGNTIGIVLELGSSIYNVGRAGMSLATGQIQLAKIQYANSEKAAANAYALIKKNVDLTKNGIMDSIALYANQVDAAKKAANAAAVKPPKGGGGIGDTDAATLAAQKLRDEWEKTAATLQYKIDTSNLDEFDKKMADIAQEVKKFRAMPGANQGLIDQYQLSEETKVIEEWYKKYIEGQTKASEAYRRQEEAKQKSIEKGAKETADSIDKYNKGQAASAEKLLQDKMDLYKDLVGFEDEYRKTQLEWIDKIRKAEIAAGLDKEAANKKASESIAKVDQAMFEAKSKQVSDALGQMASTFQAIGGMYDKNSAEYARMQEAAKVMIVLQNAVAVANAVAAIANQGLGDPYTAFARIAAMAAAMGGLLASAGLSLGGGSVSAPSAAYGQNTTVLGGANDEGSQSIQKSWELLQDTYDMEYRELSGIYNEMKDLNQNITGLVTNVVRYGTNTGKWDTSSSSTMGTAQKAWLKWQGNLDNTFEKLGGGGGLLGVLTGSAIYSAIDRLTNNLFGKAIGKIFGGGTETSVIKSGIMAGGATVGGMLSGQGFDELKAFAKIKSVKDGGWFSGDETSYSTRYDELDAQTYRLFTKVFENMSGALSELGAGLGADMSAVASYAFSNIEINLLGKTTEEINDAINEAISTVGDTAAEALFGTIISQYQQLGEGLFETASRLLIDKAIVLDTLAMTGQAFTGSTTQTIAFSESVIQMAGGLEKLRDSAETYFDKFFTDEEKQLWLTGQLTSAMDDMDLPLSSTRSGYRRIIEALDLTTESGLSASVAMRDLSEAADQYYSTLEESSQDAANAQRDLVDSLKEVSESIDAWINNLKLSDLAPVQSAAEWSRQYAASKAAATAPGATQESVSAYLDFATKYLEFEKSFGTSGSYKDVYSSVLSDVEGLGTGIDEQLTVAQSQLTVLESIEANTALLDQATQNIIAYLNEQRAINAAQQAAAATEAAQQPAVEQETAAQTRQYAIDQWSHYYLMHYGDPNEIPSVPEPSYDFSRFISVPQMASGGITRGLTIAGEAGDELIFPLTEPKRSNFLRAVGVDSEEIGKSIAKYINVDGGGDIHVSIQIDGREIGNVVARQMTTNGDLQSSVRRLN